MDFRTKRQIAVIAIVLFVLLAPLAVLVYLNLPQPTCEDKRRNQGEEEVDCGGPCIPCALKHPEEMNVFWVRFVPVRENMYDAVAQIHNPNIKLGAVQFEYEFRFFDTEGVQVARRSGRSFAFPGETAHVIETGIQTMRTLSSATLEIKGEKWVFTDASPPDVAVGDRKFTVLSERSETRLDAVIVNRSLVDFNEVFAYAIVADELGNVYAVSKTTERQLSAGESRRIFFSWPLIIPLENASAGIYVRVNTVGSAM